VGLPDTLAGSGITLSLTGSRLPGGVGDTYDWVGFAPRGLAPSSPTLSCIPDYLDFNRPDYVVTTPAAEHAWLNRLPGGQPGPPPSGPRSSLAGSAAGPTA
jgi:hypothetical protein